MVEFLGVGHERETDLVEELEGGDLDAVEFLVAEEDSDGLVDDTGVGLQEFKVEYFSEQVPSEHPDSSISAFSEPQNPPE
jgi:hypothetical protein